jgi:cytochrome c biogenesis protein CcmG/thiol:disulfide interchange protein DsbE
MRAITSCVMFLSLALGFSPQVWADTAIKAGSPAPPLSLRDILQAPQGTHGTWEELKGKAVVLEFWATWCGGCVDNIAHLNELAEHFDSQPLQFISVTDETDVDLVKRFLTRHPIRGWVAFDAAEATFKRYGIEGRPRTLLVSPSGVVQAITNPESVTPQILEDLLAGSPLNLPEAHMGTLLGLEPNAPLPLLQVLIRPAAPVDVSGMSPGAGIAKDGRYDLYGMTLIRILSEAYDVPQARIDAPQWCGQVKYDFSVVTPQHEETLRWPLLKQALESAFRLRIHTEGKETRVYILKQVDGEKPKLRVATTQGGTSNWDGRKGEVEAIGTPIGRVAQIAHDLLDSEVIDETGLTGRYDFELKWNGKQPASIVVAIREQLGLELVEEHRKLEHLVVDSIEETKTW